MRFFCLLLTLSFAALGSLPASGQTPASSESKYWVFIAEDPDGPHVLVTERALRRRQVRGRSVTWVSDREIRPEFLERLRALGVTPVVQSRWLNAISAYLSDDQRRSVDALPFVRSVRRVASASYRPLPPAKVPAVPKMGDVDFGPSRNQLAVMNAVTAIQEGINGSGVRIGFLDTPFGQFEHPAFARLIAEGRLIEVRDFVGRLQEEHTHGMSVASAAVGYDEGRLIGPAHGAEVLAAVTEYVPTETNQEEDFFVAGLEWLEAMGADVVNVSLGYTTFDRGERSYTREDLDGDTGVTTIAADRAAALGVVVVASAGNSACSSPNQCWYYIGTPADADSIVTVGAVSADSSRSSFSSFGPTADGRTKPDVAALGTGVYVATPGGYAFANGTSFSSPLVAGVVCQMLQVNPSLTPTQVLHVLRATASRATSPDNSIGWGIVNAAAAIEAARAIIHQPDGSRLSTSVFPNPATDDVFIDIMAESGGNARIAVYDLLGREVIPVVEQYAVPGRTTIRVPIGDLGSGVYFFEALVDRQRSSGSFVVSR